MPSTSFVLLAYGTSYAVIGTETMKHRKCSSPAHTVCICLWLACLVQLALLPSLVADELFFLFYPCAWIHVALLVHVPVSDHFLGEWFNYLGCLGPAFVLSQAMPSTLGGRLVVQTLPLLWLLHRTVPLSLARVLMGKVAEAL